MIGNKIKALLNYMNKSTSDVCKHINIMQPAFSRKINNNTFKAEELIELATLTNTKLAFINENNQPIIIFDESDLKSKE